MGCAACGRHCLQCHTCSVTQVLLHTVWLPLRKAITVLLHSMAAITQSYHHTCSASHQLIQWQRSKLYSHLLTISGVHISHTDTVSWHKCLAELFAVLAVARLCCKSHAEAGPKLTASQLAFTAPQVGLIV